VDTAWLFNGFEVKTRLDTPERPETAAELRTRPEAYRVEVVVHADSPTPARTAEDLAEVNPKLPHLFTDFNLLMETATVSPAFSELYARKQRWMQSRLARLETLLSRHNYFDCETILQWQHPVSGRRALLMQGDMDVNTDGSDGDRNVELDVSSPTFQPQTSYRWPKLTQRVNPALAGIEKALVAAKSELSTPGISAAREKELKPRIDQLASTMSELRRVSFLVATSDPYIVVPLFMLDSGQKEWQPRIGDSALVIADNQIFPAIVGDAGPSHKFGEASLRIARQINLRATGMSRPVSSLRITYVVFPQTAERPMTAPDLAAWGARAQKHLTELGGSPVELYTWPDIVKPWPTPTPLPSPSPTPSVVSETPKPGQEPSPPGPG